MYFRIFDKENKQRMSYYEAEIRCLKNGVDISSDILEDLQQSLRGNNSDGYWIDKNMFTDTLEYVENLEDNNNFVADYYYWEKPLAQKNKNFVVEYGIVGSDSWIEVESDFYEAWHWCKDWCTGNKRYEKRYAYIYKSEDDIYDDSVDCVASFYSDDKLLGR